MRSKKAVMFQKNHFAVKHQHLITFKIMKFYANFIMILLLSNAHDVQNLYALIIFLMWRTKSSYTFATNIMQIHNP